MHLKIPANFQCWAEFENSFAVICRSGRSPSGNTGGGRFFKNKAKAVFEFLIPENTVLRESLFLQEESFRSRLYLRGITTAVRWAEISKRFREPSDLLAFQ